MVPKKRITDSRWRTSGRFWPGSGLRWALIAGGVAVAGFVPAFGVPGVRGALAVVLTAGGGVLAALAVRRWQDVQTAMRRDQDLPATRIPFLLGGAIFAVVVAVLVVLFVWPPAGQ